MASPPDLAAAPPDEGRTLRALRRLGGYLLQQPRRWAWVPPLAWAGLIWLLSSMRFSMLAGSGTNVSFFANLAHAFEFGVLAVLLLPLVPRDGEWIALDPYRVKVVAAVTIGYAFLDELHQYFVPGRTPSPFDVLTDAVGVFCTLKVVLYLSEPTATSSGLWGRLIYSVFLCAVAAGFSTLSGL